MKNIPRLIDIKIISHAEELLIAYSLHIKNY